MFGFNTEKKACTGCGYAMIAPFPSACPKCGAILEKIESSVTSRHHGKPATGKKDQYQDRYYRMRLAKVIDEEGRVPPALPAVPDEDEEGTLPVNRDPCKNGENATALGEGGDYVKMMGVINLATRNIIFCSSKNHEFILELGANAHDIASSILGGTLERVLFEAPRKPDAGEEKFEEAMFSARDDLLFCIHGSFKKRPEVLLQGLQRVMGDVFKGKPVDVLSKMDRNEVERRAVSFMSHIVSEYKKITGTSLRRVKIPTMENQAVLHYIGLSYQSIGTLSLLLDGGGDDALSIKDMGFDGDTSDGTARELVESLISAKIEAIAANTLAGVGVFPRYIITKIGFDSYRIIEFLQLENEYNLQVLASGNVEILEGVIRDIIIPEMAGLISMPFKGQLTSHNSVKKALQEKLASKRVFQKEG